MRAVDSSEDTSAGERDWAALAGRIRAWGAELGFARLGVADLDVAHAADRLEAWLAEGRHGAMQYMQRHAAIRRDATRLLPGARRAIVARMDYVPRDAPPDWLEHERARVSASGEAIVSIYARGRDYHKVLRQRA
jgi:epoxyqueuosine reductase